MDMLDDSNKDNRLAYRHAGIWIGTTQHLKLKCAMEKRELTKLADGEHETVLRDGHVARRLKARGVLQRVDSGERSRESVR